MKAASLLGRHSEVTRNAKSVCQAAIVDVELYQGFGMLRYEGDRHDQHGRSVLAARSISCSVLGSIHRCGVARDW